MRGIMIEKSFGKGTSLISFLHNIYLIIFFVPIK